eukprot:GHRR01034827.1.p1 GENE.GHRR01034827.1~~GHRR01034827.1.p1  ORF type:complete len:131 (-),score=18.60 GHRR01034827.1:415-807(-)
MLANAVLVIGKSLTERSHADHPCLQCGLLHTAMRSCVSGFFKRNGMVRLFLSVLVLQTLQVLQPYSKRSEIRCSVGFAVCHSRLQAISICFVLTRQCSMELRKPFADNEATLSTVRDLVALQVVRSLLQL